MDVKQGERGPRGRSARGEWVRWGLTMLALVVAFVNIADIRGVAQRVEFNAHKADTAIVQSGRAVIRNGCQFDNVRAHELRAILKRGLKNQRKLFKTGALPRERYIDSRRGTRKAIRGISIRDCAHEAMTLKLKE